MLTTQSILELIKAQTESQDAAIKKNRAEFFYSLQESRKEFSSSLQESRKEFSSSLQESRKEFNEQMSSINKKLKNVGKKIGSLTDRWSEFVEGMVIPNLIPLFNEKGIKMERSYSNVVEKKDGKIFYEIDVLVTNDKYVIAVD